MSKFNVGDPVRVKYIKGAAYPGTSGVIIAIGQSPLYTVRLDPYGDRDYHESYLESSFPGVTVENESECRVTLDSPEVPDPMRQPASTTAPKLRRWMEMEKEVNRLKTQLQKAQGELDAAVQDLGEYLCPPGCAATGDEFHIWVGDSMVRTKVLDLEKKKYIVVPHYKGKNWGRW